MKARTRSISPGSMVLLKAENDPFVSGAVAARGEWSSKYFIVVRLLLESLHRFQHRAHLDSKIAQLGIGAIGQ